MKYLSRRELFRVTAGMAVAAAVGCITPRRYPRYAQSMNGVAWPERSPDPVVIETEPIVEESPEQPERRPSTRPGQLYIPNAIQPATPNPSPASICFQGDLFAYIQN